MERIPEPELMDDEAQVRAYADADFAEPHDHFVALLQDKLADLGPAGTAIDLGCGAGDISRRFARALPGWRVRGIDGSPTMLRVAAELTLDAGLADRIGFDEVLLPAANCVGACDLILSNSLLHHLADPDVFWSAVRDWSQPGGAIFVMDLLRPPDRATAERFVSLYAADEPEVLQVDFFNSLLAAFEVDELRAQLDRAGLGDLPIEVVSDRHVIVWGRVNGP
ncbi:MAG: class I SAM-dependent methyltransferase [Gammaproteobacteria bacterium]